MQKAFPPFTSLITSLLVAAGTVYIAYSVYPTFTEASTDRAVLRYLGMVVSNGGIFYEEVFENKPPLLVLMLALAHKIHYHASWYFMTGIVVAASLFLLAACKKVKLPQPWLYPLLFAGLIYHPAISAGGELIRQYTACWVMMFLAGLFFQSKGHYLLSGLMMALIGSFVPTELFMLLPLLGYRFFYEKAPGITAAGKRTWIMTGVMIGLLPAIIYLTLQNSWVAFFDKAFLFNMQWYQHGSFFDKAVLSFQLMRSSRLVEYPLLFSVLFTLFLILQSSVKRLLIVLTVTCFVLQVILFGIVEYMHLSYFYSVLPLCFWLLLNVKESAPNFFQHQKVQWLIVTAAIYIVLITGKPFYYSATPTERKADLLLKQFPQLEEVRNTKGQVYVFNGYTALELNVRLNVQSPVYWPVLFPWSFWPDKWDTDGSLIQHDIIDALEKSRCRFLVDARGSFQLKHKKAEALLKSYILQHYIADTITCNSREQIILWERMQ
jgi:hypothetical protein